MATSGFALTSVFPFSLGFSTDFEDSSEPDDELSSSSLPSSELPLLESLAVFFASSFFGLAFGFSDSEEESLSSSSEDFLDSLLSESEEEEEGGVSTFYFFFFDELALEAALFLLALDALEAFETFDSALALLAGTFKVFSSLLLLLPLPSELEPESLLESSESEIAAIFFLASSIAFFMASSSFAAFSLAACLVDFLVA